MTGFEELLEKNRKLADRLLEKAIPRDMGRLTDSLSKPIWEFLDRGGKRWRPMLATLCCEALNGHSDQFRDILILPELLHNGSLIVDDIEDGSELRRGKPALHKIFGMDIALNAANYLYFLPFKMVKESGISCKERIYELIGTETLKLHIGQAADILWHKTPYMPSQTEYFEMCANKTGSMARLSAKLGAAVAGASEKDAEALGKFAESIGVAFQIQDDILNIEQGLGKEYGEDITEGKKSLPAILAFSAAMPQEKSRLAEILAMHTREKKLIGEAIAVMKKYGAISYAEKMADDLIAQSLENISFLHETEAKRQLVEMAAYMVKRKH
jgi:geranylgeranyl pyrophosphate synthase